MTKIPFSKSVIANTVTSLNAFCGFLSIIYTSQGDYRTGSIMIIAAAVFDMLDGIIARLLGTSSRFGVELDSLSDVVSFGAAPAFLIYTVFMFHYGAIGIVLSSFLLVFGALRLARFNIQIEDLNTKGDFNGLPIPVSAMTISLFVISFYQNSEIMNPFIVIPLIIVLSLLMVSRIRYNALPKLRDKNFRYKIILFGSLIVALALSLVTNGQVLFFIFIAIILFGILRKVYYLLFSNKDEN